MRLRVNQLQRALESKLAQTYFVSGDEPLQLVESTDAIRKQARQLGFTTREIYDVNAAFDWNDLLQSANSLSLFSEKRILEVHLLSGKPGNHGSKVLVELSENPREDTLLLVTAPKIPGASQKSKWFKSLDNNGVIIQVWPLEYGRIEPWIKARMESRDLQTDTNGLSLLASRVEGNLLAAAQEIDKIFVIHGPGMVSGESVQRLVADNSRFDVFKLMDAVLVGDIARATKILLNLIKEGISPPVILWGLMKETRSLTKMRFMQDSGQPIENIFRENGVWDKRKPLVLSALKRLDFGDLSKILRHGAYVDRVIKGQERGDARDELLKICAGLSGLNSVPI